jgi:PadR family transcriptional regulator PadR
LKECGVKWEGMKVNSLKEVQVKIMKGLLDFIVLQFLGSRPMHGYQIITEIRKTFGVYFGPSTIYPLLNALEKSGYVKSEWDVSSERPRKIYKLTAQGRNLLNFTEDSLNLICKKIEAVGIQRNADLGNVMQTSFRSLVKNREGIGAQVPPLK